jgi:hypothetical protein
VEIHPQLSAYLQQVAPSASYGHPGYWVNVQIGFGWTAETVNALADSFLADADFVRLGTWLGTPEGHVIAATVEHSLPYPYRQFSELFVLALTRAAEQQAAHEQEKARNWVLVGAGAVALAALTWIARSA